MKAINVMRLSPGQYRKHRFPPVALQNSAGAQAMLAGMLNHHQHEKVLLDAECEYSRRQLEACHAKVKGLEMVAERWKTKQRYEQARKEQKLMEEIINARHKKKVG